MPLADKIKRWLRPVRRTSVALFIDYENLALAYRSGGSKQPPDLGVVIEFARSMKPGTTISHAFAYADWGHFSEHKAPLEELSIEQVQVTAQPVHGKNATDILMAVDMIDMMHRHPDIGTYLLVTGDSDFAPVVSRLRDRGKRVVGVGVKGSVSGRLRTVCDSFHEYEQLYVEKPEPIRQRQSKPVKSSSPAKKREAPTGDATAKARERLRLVDGYVIGTKRLLEILPLAAETVRETQAQHVAELRKGISRRYPGKISAQETATLAALLYAVGAYGSSGGWIEHVSADGQLAFDLLLASARDTLTERERSGLSGVGEMVELITGENIDHRELQMRLSRGKKALADLTDSSAGSS